MLLERNTLPQLSPSSEGEVRAGGHQRSQNQMCELGSLPNGAPVFSSPGPVFTPEGVKRTFVLHASLRKGAERIQF